MPPCFLILYRRLDRLVSSFPLWKFLNYSLSIQEMLLIFLGRHKHWGGFSHRRHRGCLFFEVFFFIKSVFIVFQFKLPLFCLDSSLVSASKLFLVARIFHRAFQCLHAHCSGILLGEGATGINGLPLLCPAEAQARGRASSSDHRVLPRTRFMWRAAF